ncbi:hypothetical protein BDZ89DRAFT_1061239 [Hymenopellis radicata]|nr:hypothetical protein BDZ89DRAFT_1061239 [Hymenopellis radicata]
MLYRFISLFLVDAPSLGAITTNSCSAVVDDCDAFANGVNVFKEALYWDRYHFTYLVLNGRATKVLRLVQPLNKIMNNEEAHTFYCWISVLYVKLHRPSSGSKSLLPSPS